MLVEHETSYLAQVTSKFTCILQAHAFVEQASASVPSGLNKSVVEEGGPVRI